jgi:hypothetical protein
MTGCFQNFKMAIQKDKIGIAKGIIFHFGHWPTKVFTCSRKAIEEYKFRGTAYPWSISFLSAWLP